MLWEFAGCAELRLLLLLLLFFLTSCAALCTDSNGSVVAALSAGGNLHDVLLHGSCVRQRGDLQEGTPLTPIYCSYVAFVFVRVVPFALPPLLVVVHACTFFLFTPAGSCCCCPQHADQTHIILSMIIMASIYVGINMILFPLWLNLFNLIMSTPPQVI